MQMTTAEFNQAVERVRTLGETVSVRQTALLEARVFLGWYLIGLRGRVEKRDYDAVVRESGLHLRRITEAVRMAEAVAADDGSVDWARYTDLRAAKGLDTSVAPSVRSVNAAIAARHASEVVAAGVGGGGGGGVGGVGGGVLTVGADEDRIVVDEEEFVVEEVGAGMGVRGLTFDEDEVINLDAEVVALETPTARDEVANEVRTVRTGPDRRTLSEPPAWRMGAQMTFGDLLERADGLVEDLTRTLRGLGADAEIERMLEPVRGFVRSRRGLAVVGAVVGAEVGS